MSGWGSDEVAQARLRAREGEIAAARMAIDIHERTVNFFDSRGQPFMSQRARERADRAREILWRALAEQLDITP
jgi:hypothetical protein